MANMLQIFWDTLNFATDNFQKLHNLVTLINVHTHSQKQSNTSAAAAALANLQRHTTTTATTTTVTQKLYTWSSLVEGGEGSNLPNCRTNLVIVIYTLYLLFCKFINTTAYNLGRYEPSSPISCRAPWLIHTPHFTHQAPQ